jgi:hypothetical protein
MMIRTLCAALYAGLVRLHPRSFRGHFGDEMLSIFDHTESADRFGLVGDAAVSLLRQRLLRPEVHEPENSARAGAGGVPLFLVLEDDARLGTDRWMGGAALSLLSFAAVSFLIAHGGNRSAMTFGSRNSSQAGVRVQSAPGMNLDAEVAVNPDLEPRDHGLGAAYFRAIAVLDALDVNHDLIISADEIANAPAALKSLDRNHDGALDATECRPNFSRQFKTLPGDEGFMRMHPVLAALDADGDGVISASEIRNAAAALWQLDRNHDGRLTADELLPEYMLKLTKRGS